MNMVALQLVCLGIVAAYVAARLARARGPARWAFLGRFLALATGAALGEDSMIRLYGAYRYAPTWSVFVDRVPLVVVLIWPVVIESACTLVRRLVPPEPRHVALMTSAIVLADASLIEPIAVRAGLWSWAEPGLLEVPLFGIAGWALFAGAATFLLERGVVLATVALAPVATHALVLATYWGLFRWLAGPIAPVTVVVAAWGAMLGLVTMAWRAGRQVPLEAVMLRAPGAAFFFVLLAILPEPGPPRAPLVLYALAFALPYLALILGRTARCPWRANLLRDSASAPSCLEVRDAPECSSCAGERPSLPPPRSSDERSGSTTCRSSARGTTSRRRSPSR